jgi:multisubunit Na+/H+ antiporter MnhE subunit
MTTRQPAPSKMRVKFWILWYVPLFVLWLAFVSTLATEEVVLGLVAAAIAATAADLVRAQDLVRFRLEWRWLRDLYRLPWQVLAGSWALALALWRQLTGRPVMGSFVALPFPADQDAASAAARIALVTGTVSLTPNAFVVGVEGDEGFVLLHQLALGATDPIPRSMLENPR